MYAPGMRECGAASVCAFLGAPPRPPRPPAPRPPRPPRGANPRPPPPRPPPPNPRPPPPPPRPPNPPPPPPRGPPNAIDDTPLGATKILQSTQRQATWNAARPIRRHENACRGGSTVFSSDVQRSNGSNF